MHELGHALGIQHSNVKAAIMHGQYQKDVLNLQPDDIRAANKLYPGELKIDEKLLFLVTFSGYIMQTCDLKKHYGITHG